MQPLLFEDDRPAAPRSSAGDGIPALSLTQPWATLMVLGAKRIETRAWGARYRGPLAIHAAKTFPADAQRLCFREPFSTVLRGAGILSPSQLPRGVVLAIGRLVDCVQVSQTMRREPPPADSNEWAFGDLSLGRYLWYFEDVEPLETPIPARGALGLWEWVS